jgi:hypothetical protein
MPDRLVIVVPYSEEQATRSRIMGLATSGWEQHVQLVGGPDRRGPGDSARIESKRILEIVDKFDADVLIVTKEICCDSRTIQARQKIDLRRPPIWLLRDQLITRELRSRGLHWREVLKERLAYWNSKKNNPDDWLRQFGEAYWVGETLLRQIDVIRPNEVLRAFQTPAQAMVGQRLVFAFISDDDPASSSNRIGGLLTQIYGPALVRNFVAAVTQADTGSHLVVCEDALWTGIELRSLLGRLGTGGDLEQAAKSKRITFRHCVVSDYGLWIVRQYISYAKLDFVDLSLGEGQRFIRVLAQDISDAEILSRWGMAPTDFEDWLTTHVRPIAFQDESLWRGRQEQAQQICAEIGRQLINKYVIDEKKNWREGVRDWFALGAGRFGSAIVFAHSVPKVCFPLLWLQGQVFLGETKIDWKPLFYDARRAR